MEVKTTEAGSGDFKFSLEMKLLEQRELLLVAKESVLKGQSQNKYNIISLLVKLASKEYDRELED